MFALALALPAAFFASKLYLDFFADRIESPIVILAVSGAIAVTLLAELPNSSAIGTDLSEDALTCALNNARLHGVADRFQPLCSDYLKAMGMF